MIRAFWFFIQVAAIVTVALWLLERPGTVIMEIMDYKVTVTAGVFLLGALVFLGVSYFVLRFLDAVIALPSFIRSYRRRRDQEKGYQALTRGFVAVAAGDTHKATRYARQVMALWPNQTAMPLLLEAQAAHLRGDKAAARKSFESLMKDKDASFLGIRGLLRTSLEEGNVVGALDYARKAQELHPKQGWVLKTLYDLQIRNGKWDEAEKTLKKTLKRGGITSDQARSDQVALHLLKAQKENAAGNDKQALSEIKQAYRIDPLSVPAAIALAGRYLADGKHRKATPILEKIWPINPHPDLVPLWDALAPENKKKDALVKMRWYEKLVAQSPRSAEGQMAAAKAAMQAGLWGEAKAYLAMAEKIQPSARLYKLRAEAARKTGEGEDAVREWLEKAAAAPPEKRWICSRTGQVYDRWSPIAQPQGSFNTIIWDYPGTRRAESLSAPYETLAFEAA